MQWKASKGRRAAWLCLAGLLCAATCIAQETPEDPGKYVTPEAKARLDAGKVVLFKKGSKDSSGKSRGQGRVLVVVNRPQKDVWEHISRFDKHPEFMPHLTRVDLYYRKGNEVGIKQTVRVLFSNTEYHILQQYDEAKGTLAWRLDRSKKNDIVDTQGYWAIAPYGEGKTLVMYALTVDSGMFIPQALQNFLFNHSLPGVVEAMKKRTESGGTYKK